MQRKAPEMTQSLMQSATARAGAYVNRILAGAKALELDERKVERIAKHECKSCFYGGRMGGAAMTEQPCMSCTQPQLYSSTATDVLCRPCAEYASLCKHCGGDLEMRLKRRTWPDALTDEGNTS